MTSRLSPIQALIAAVTTKARRRLAGQCPRFAEPVELAERARLDVLALAGLVREEDPEVLFGALAQYSAEQLAVLVVVAVAHIPIDMTAGDLLAWTERLTA